MTAGDSYTTFFRNATDNEPYDYQARLALEQRLPELLTIPTGLGKTAAVVLAWLWRRRFADGAVRDTTPRRLVYCLPMRVLVEQVYTETIRWLARLDLLAGRATWGDVDEDGHLTQESRLVEYRADFADPRRIAVHLLMGGEDANDWYIYPERDAILVGTQDMLLSRALNRGYGMSRYRWPIEFALLNNDCVWAFDEVQLMDSGVATTTQLEAFRRKLNTSLHAQSLWMSATLNPQWLETIDFDRNWLGEPHRLTDADRRIDSVRRILEAPKCLQRAAVAMGDADEAARAIAEAHVAGTRTLAVFNTVKRAVDVYNELKKTSPAARLVVIHSRFRPRDREEKMRQLLDDPPPGGIIAITTQVVEAGVDVSARTLFTELAPWSSLVQRFGRCNRRGEFNEAENACVYWLDWLSREQFKAQYTEEQRSKQKKPTEPEIDKKYADYLDGIARPYSLQDLRLARECLVGLGDVGPASLDQVEVDMRLEAEHVIRRRDFLDLFDTTPDLAGNDIDVSRFIRSGQEFDVQVFWRDVPKGVKGPDPDEEHGKAPLRYELCSVPVYEFGNFVKKKRGLVWRWDALERQWSIAAPEDVYAGQTFLVRRDAGGYDTRTGWAPKSKEPVEPVPQEPSDEPDAYDREDQFGSPWQSIDEHTEEVVKELAGLAEALGLHDETRTLLLTAARCHDWGKAHDIFQAAILDGRERPNGSREPDRPQDWLARRDIGKAPDRKSPVNFWGRYARPHFRHELASALAVLQEQQGIIPDAARDLVAYLVAAHHGKVRLSIRSLPREKPSEDDPTRLYARGVWDGDELPAVDLGGDVKAPQVRLSLECMQVGRSSEGEPSWAERMLRLREEQGPFRLAFWEALLRAADIRASRRASQRPQTNRQEGNRS